MMKKFHIYSDESRHKNERFLLLSGLWIEESDIETINYDVSALRKKHGYINSEGSRIDFVGEFKWTKVSDKYFHVYKDVVDLLFEWIEKDLARFNTVLIDTHDPMVTAYSNIDREGYYKFLYQLYFHNSRIPGIYKIFPDRITNPTQHNVKFNILMECLNSGLLKKFKNLVNPAILAQSQNFVESIIPVDSKKCQPIQVLDVVMGGIGFLQNELDQRENARQAKVELMNHIIEKLVRSRAIRIEGKKYFIAKSTKFNIWLFRPKKKPSPNEKV